MARTLIPMSFFETFEISDISLNDLGIDSFRQTKNITAAIVEIVSCFLNEDFFLVPSLLSVK